MTGPSAAPGESRERQFSRLLMALAAVTAAIVAPVAAAIAVGGEAGNPLNLALEGISSASSGLVRDVRVVLPIGFAFAAGMASALNPCAFFLIPAYLGLYMHEGAGQGPRQRAAQGLTVAATVAVSFIVLFAVVGSAVGLAASLVIGVLPIVALAVGLGLILAGAYRINGGSIHALAVQRLSVRLAPGTGGGLGRYFLFGLAYGAASLSCTLPVFLAVVGSALTSGGVLGSARDFALFGVGMATVVATVTLGMVGFEATITHRVQGLGRIVDPLGTVMLLAAGSYVIFYWLTLGGLLGPRAA